MHPERGPGAPLGERPVDDATSPPLEHVETSRASDRLMGRQSPPMRTGHVEVLAERTVGDDVDGPLPGIVTEVDGDLVRVVYALEDDDGTIVESGLHADQVRQLVGQHPASWRRPFG